MRIDDEDFRFGTSSNVHEDDIKALESGDGKYDHGYDDIKKEHVLRYLWEDEDLSVTEIGELAGVKDWLIEKCLAYHDIDRDAYQGPVPKHPPWRPRPSSDMVKSVSGGRSLGYNHQ